jgi:acyl dehydratase
MSAPTASGDRFVVGDDTPSRALALDAIEIGASVEQSVMFDEEMWRRFDALAGDAAPVHRQSTAARALGFDRPILQGLAVTTRFSRLLGMYLPGEHAVLQRVEFRFRRPVLVPALLDYRAEVTRVLRPVRAVQLALEVRVGAEVHVTGSAQCVLR